MTFGQPSTGNLHNSRPSIGARRGYGIYVVFWFGKHVHPLVGPPKGSRLDKPQSQAELQDALDQYIRDAGLTNIAVKVLDVSRPPPWTPSWREPLRIEAHRLIRRVALDPLPATAIQRDALPPRTVEEVFYAGLLKDVTLGPQDQINRQIDAAFDSFRSQPILSYPLNLPTWGEFGKVANNRRPVAQTFLGLELQAGREFLASAQGRFLVRALPFENRQRQNDTHEVLYFRDSGIHRRLIERTLDVGEQANSDSASIEDMRKRHLESFEGKRWEAFVVNTIIDLVGRCCNAFAFRHEERSEIDLVLEWTDRNPAERWAIEVASLKWNTHPNVYFEDECNHLGVKTRNRFVVRRANDCDGGARGRGGVRAISLLRMIEELSQWMRR